MWILVTGALLWLAIVLVTKDHDLNWWDVFPRLLVATLAYLALYVVIVVVMKLPEPIGFVVAIAAYMGLIFHYLWNNYGGMGLKTILIILGTFLLLNIILDVLAFGTGFALSSSDS